MTKKAQRKKWKIRKMIQRRYPTEGLRCEVCGSDRRLERHHRNFSFTDNRAKNIAIICRECHVEVHSVAGVAIVAND